MVAKKEESGADDEQSMGDVTGVHSRWKSPELLDPTPPAENETLTQEVFVSGAHLTESRPYAGRTWRLRFSRLTLN